MADEKITGGIRNTTSDGGSTTADVTIQNGAFNAASIGIVRPTGDGQQWSVSAQVNAVNGVVDGGQVKFSLGATPTSGDPVVSTTQQQYQMPNGETRTLEMPRISNQYADPGVNRTAVGVEVTGAQQQVLSTSVAGFDINASAAPRVGAREPMPSGSSSRGRR